MTDEQFAELLTFALDRNHEQHGLEFKGARPRSDRLFFAKVVRAMLGMANRRDGGTVIIGVDESAGKLVPTGLTPADLHTWRHDDLATDVANYADPPITFDAVERSFEGKSFVVIQVSEFDDVPILCKKPYNHSTTRPGGRSETVKVLRDGACYVRSRRKPETTDIPSQAEMRELLDLATAKSLQRLVSQLRSAGVSLQGVPAPSDTARFDQQLTDLFGE